MTDRELLELAAKAVGGFIYVDDMGWIAQDADGNRGSWWNPLGDDGDALRLAVKLGLMLLTSANGESLTVDSFSEHEGATVSLAGDPYAATRRAIVRAAAEIGKALP